MIIAHQQGAVMAQQETAQGGKADAKAFAATIVTDRQAKITQVQGLLIKA